MVCLCVSVGHDHELCLNSLTDWDAFWGVDMWGWRNLGALLGGHTGTGGKKACERLHWLICCLCYFRSVEWRWRHQGCGASSISDWQSSHSAWPQLAFGHPLVTAVVLPFWPLTLSLWPCWQSRLDWVKWSRASFASCELNRTEDLNVQTKLSRRINKISWTPAWTLLLEYSQTHLSGYNWDLIMSIHWGRVSSYPCFIRYIVSEWDQTNYVHFLTFSYGLQCFDAVGWVAGRASGL